MVRQGMAMGCRRCGRGRGRGRGTVVSVSRRQPQRVW